MGYSNFAVPIIARTGDIKEGDYERFKDSEKPLPVIATTVDLLTTGVDVPSVRNIVIVKPISSKIVFKQIIGRGSRLDPLTDKNFFRIIDYIGATRLFDDWERVPEPTQEEPEGPSEYAIAGMVIDAETQEPITGATVTLQRSSNQQLYERTDRGGRFAFDGLPKKQFPLTVRAAGYKPRSLSLEAVKSREPIVIELAPQTKKRKKVIVKGLPVYIAEEDRLVLEKEGRMLKVEEYISYAGKEVAAQVRHIEDLRAVWLDPERRRLFLEELSQKSIYPEVIAELMQRPDIDGFDALAHVAYGSVPLTRDERAEALQNMESRFIQAFSENAREVIYALLGKYRFAGIEEIENPHTFELSPFDRMGGIKGVEERFVTIDNLKMAIDGIRQRLYVNTADTL